MYIHFTDADVSEVLPQILNLPSNCSGDCDNDKHSDGSEREEQKNSEVMDIHLFQSLQDFKHSGLIKRRTASTNPSSSMYVYTHVCMYICIYVHTYVRTYICMYVCIYVCMHVCMYVRTYVCTYVRTYVHTYYLHDINEIHLYTYICV